MSRGEFRVAGGVVAGDGTPIDPKRDALERILNSRTFANRARLRQFLSFAGEAVLENRAAELKEQALAISVFGRQSDQFTGDDNIVRVTARQLRAKIAEYYLTEGKDDPWRVEMPRGTYVPVFREAMPAAAALAAPVVVAESPKRPRKFRADWLVAAVIGALLSFLLTLAWKKEPQPPEKTILGLLQPRPDQQVLIVCADAAMQMYKVVTGSAPTLAEYEQHLLPWPKGPTPPESKAFEWIEKSRLFGSGNVSGVAKLIPAFYPGTVRVRHPRQVTDRDFVYDNVILLSGPFANPWAQLFEGKLSFQVTADANGAAYIRNIAPKPGEQAAYRMTEHDGTRRSYCRVAFLPNFSGQGRILLIGGPTGGIELMANRLSDPAFYRELQGRLGVTSSEAMPPFEVLVEATEVSGTPISVRVLCCRRQVEGNQDSFPDAHK